MGHKKRNPTNRAPARAASDAAAAAARSLASSEATSSPPSIKAAAAAAAAAPFPPMAPDFADFSCVKVECERALTAFRRGNHTKALRLMKEAATRHDSSALVHRVHATVYAKVSALLDDPNAKLRHLRAAVDSARHAVALSPSSIEFAHFYASLLCDVATATDSHGYEEVVQECERALAVADPVDPAKESLQDESQQKISTPEARIAHVQHELRALIQKANLSSISSWMKNFGNGAPGEERFRLIPVRRISEDPMEVRLGQTPRRPNEIRKAAKTPEERRKEIEVRVAAARLMQQNPSSSQQCANEGDSRMGSDSPASSSYGALRLAERRKMSSRKMAPSRGRMDQVRAYWNSMRIERRLSFLNVSVMKLKAHYASSSKDSLAQELLLEALSFFEANGTWRFWTCFKCDEKFIDAESHIQHVVHEHMGSLSTKMQSVLPLEVDGEWIGMLHNGNWKPIDATAAVKMLEEVQLKHQSIIKDVDLDGGSKDNDHLSEYQNSRENSDSSPFPQHEQLKDQDICNGLAIGSNDDYMIDFHGFSQRWPLSEDDERTKLLEKIQAMFQLFIKHKSLSASHLNKVTAYAIEEIQAFPSGSLLLKHALDQSPLCICFLGASQLSRILKFLQELSQSCGFGRLSEKDSLVADLDSAGREFEAQDEINVILNLSSLLLDGYSFTGKVGSQKFDSLGSNGNADILPDMDALFSWLSAGPSVGEKLSAWTHMREEKLHQGTKILHMLEKEFYLLQSLCERKYDHLSYEEALQSIENFCFEELKGREQAGKFASQTYEAILRKRQEELVARENDEMLINCRFELDVISNILKDAQALNVPQFGYDEALSTSRLCDLDFDEGDDWRTHDYSQQTDTCIDVAMRRQKEQLSMELNKIDAMILRNMTGMQQLEVKLGLTSAFDYRTIVLPLVKSFLWLYLEDLVDKDAIEKSEAATEAFLAELALDTKKNANKDAKHAHEKLKEKKRNKESKKTKDAKALDHNEQLLSHQETAEKYEFLVDGEILEQDLIAAGDCLKEQEDELKLSSELEAEDIKFEETLEYRRRIEDEMKEKHLEEQFDDVIATPPNYGAEEPYAVVSDSNSMDLVKNVHGTTPSFPEGTESSDFHLPKVVIHKPHENARLSQYENKSTIPDHELNGYCNEIQDEIKTDGLRSFGHINGLLKKGGLKTKASERTSTDAKSCTGSSLQKVNTTSSQFHVKYKQGISGTLHDCYASSDQKKNRQAPRRNNSTRMSEENARALPFAKENCIQVQSHHDIQQDLAAAPGDNGAKTLRQLHFEDDDEETFQEDLKEALRQSLEADDYGTSADQTGQLSNGKDVLGAGLKNAVGEYNCFLNVIIQSLWHLRRFRDGFLKTSSVHRHVGDPCVICALYDIFTSLSKASGEGQMEAISPTSLRVALSNLYPDSNFFQEAQMNDASEVLAVIFDCLHKSCTSPEGCDAVTHESNSVGSWDCTNNACIAHQLFGMDIEEHMFCRNCSLESRQLKYTSFFYNINANSLRTAKVMCTENTFDELLNIVERNHQLPCDLEAGGCGTPNYINYILSSRPHVFTTVLGWQNTNESAEDISSTLAAITTQLDVGVLYCGIDQGSKHALVSVVCYYGQHYHCFAYEHEQWVMYDDQTVKVIGSWDDVLIMCKRGHLQPQVLFFEDAN